MIPDFLYLMAWVYGLGLLAAAPVGPVNMVAIHRGAVGRWSHTLACGVGSAVVDLGFFTLAIWGGNQVLEYLTRPNTKLILVSSCAAILLPLGVIFLKRAFRLNLRKIIRSRQERLDQPPRHLWTDLGTGAGLTIINPAAPAYWLAATAPWLHAAQGPQGRSMYVRGPAGAAAGLLSWFIFLTFLVRFAPNRLGLRFFRVVNALCGVMLLCFAAYCIYLALTDPVLWSLLHWK